MNRFGVSLVIGAWLLEFPVRSTGKASCERTPSFFAEFLNEDSPVRLGLLALSTCVGFAVRTVMHEPEKLFSAPRSPSFSRIATKIGTTLGYALRGFAYGTSSSRSHQSDKVRRVQECVTPSNT